MGTFLKTIFVRLLNMNEPIWKYLRNYKFHSILIRNFFIIVLLVIMPIGMLSALYSRNSQSILLNEISSSNLNSLYRSSDMIENVMKELYSFAFNLSVSQDTRQFVYQSVDESINSGLAGNIIDHINFYIKTL